VLTTELIFAGIILCLLGGLAGFLAGLLGIGGGAVLVPGLYYIFSSFGYHDVAMHTAIGTSLLTIIFTGTASARSHHQQGAVDLMLVKQFTPGIILGVAVGTFFATLMTTQALKIVFASLQIAFGLYMLFRRSSLALFSNLPHQPWRGLIAGANAALAALMGVGGGVQNVLYMTICNIPLGRAIGTAAAIGPIIACFGAIGFAYIGFQTPNQLPMATGYIHWPSFLSIIITSVAFAPLGARLTHRLPTLKLKSIFTVFLFGVSLKMLYEVFTGA